MPSLHNIDRFLATHIANSRDAGSANRITVANPQGITVRLRSLDASGSAAFPIPTAATALVQSQLTSEPTFLSPTGSVSNGKNADSGLAAALKKFFGSFLGSAADYKSTAKDTKIKAAGKVMVEVWNSIQAARVRIEDEQFKKAVINSFNELNNGQKLTFLQRCKGFLRGILNQEGDKIRNYAPFQLAETIHGICAGDVPGNVKVNASPVVGTRDFSPLPSSEEIARLLKGED
jgi:hypothetical protein